MGKARAEGRGMLALCRFARFAARNRTVHKTRHDLDRSHPSIMNKQKKQWRYIASAPLPSTQACPKKVSRAPRKRHKDRGGLLPTERKDKRETHTVAGERPALYLLPRCVRIMGVRR